MARSALVALALVLACDKGGDSAPASAPAEVAKGPPLASMDFFRIDAKPVAPCAPGDTCMAELVLTALGDYKVNDDYPFKFVGDPDGDCTVEGTGTFKKDSAKRGTMTVRFRPAKPGAALTGTFKLSVCTEEECEIESPAITLPIGS